MKPMLDTKKKFHTKFFSSFLPFLLSFSIHQCRKLSSFSSKMCLISFRHLSPSLNCIIMARKNITCSSRTALIISVQSCVGKWHISRGRSENETKISFNERSHLVKSRCTISQKLFKDSSRKKCLLCIVWLY